MNSYWRPPAGRLTWHCTMYNIVSEISILKSGVGYPGWRASYMPWFIIICRRFQSHRRDFEMVNLSYSKFCSNRFSNSHLTHGLVLNKLRTDSTITFWIIFDHSRNRCRAVPRNSKSGFSSRMSDETKPAEQILVHITSISPFPSQSIIFRPGLIYNWILKLENFVNRFKSIPSLHQELHNFYHPELRKRLWFWQKSLHLCCQSKSIPSDGVCARPVARLRRSSKTQPTKQILIRATQANPFLMSIDSLFDSAASIISRSEI